MYFSENELLRLEHEFLTTVMGGEAGRNETIIHAPSYIKGVVDFVNACVSKGKAKKEEEVW